ncbi:MAG: endonuclease [Bacilli bacterium]|nr:endonuclease [Bacilli bacterium]
MKNKISILILTSLLFAVSACQSKKSTPDTPVEPDTPVVPDKEAKWDEAAQTVSISSLNSKGKATDNSHLYRITGVVQYISSTTYGNFDIIDSTGSIYVYGCSAYASSITSSGSTYSFTNSKNFFASGVKQGDTVELIGLYLYYSYPGSDYGYGEFQGFVRKINAKGNYTLEGKDYTAAETYSGSYYNSITATGGNDLADQLHDLMDTTHDYYTTYSGLYNCYKNTGEYSGSKYKCIYSGSYFSSVNREHVWPQSMSNGLWGEDHGGSDLLHVRPAYANYNSARSNSPFGEIVGDNISPRSISYAGGGACRYATKVFEPADSIKGDIARIIMYVYLHYGNEYGTKKQSFYGDLSLGDVLAPYYDDKCYFY